MADPGILVTTWDGFCTPGGHGPVAMILGGGFCNGVHIFGNSIIVEPGIVASISYSGRWHPFIKHPPSIGAVTMELVDDTGKVWASSTGNVTSRSQYASIGAGAEALTGALPLGTSYRLMATVHDGTMCPPSDPRGKLVISSKGRPALKDAARGGPNLPHDAQPVRFKGLVHTRATRFGLKIRKWPKKRGKKATPKQKVARDNFKRMVTLVKQVPVWDRGAAQAIAHNSGWTYRDVLSKAVTGTLWSVPGMEQAALPFLLDALSSIEGAILYRSPDGWVGLLPGAGGEVISIVSGQPAWVDPSTLALGITQLHGDVIAGPGTGNVATALKNSGVTAGVYHHVTLQCDVNGRIIDAANGEAATVAALGLVKPDGTTITIDGTGTISATATTPGIATLAANGVSRPDGTTMTINGGGQLTALGGGGGGIGGLFSAAMSSRVTQTGSGPWSNAGTGTVTDTTSGMVLNSGAGTCWLTKNIPAGIHAASALFQQTALTATNTECYIGFSDGTKAVLAALEWNGSAWRYVVYRWNAFNSFGSTAFQGPTNHVNSWLWLKAYDDGTRINFYFSNDGITWINFYNELRLANLASVSKLVLASYSGAGGVACNTLVSSYAETAS